MESIMDKKVVNKEILEARFGNDDNYDIEFDENYGSTFSDGTSVVFCTSFAIQVQRLLPDHHVIVVGFNNEDNNDCDAAREKWGDGHDFAIVDDRYLVDPWARLVAGVRDQIVYDLEDAGDLSLVKKIYGLRKNWKTVREAISSVTITKKPDIHSVIVPAKLVPWIGDMQLLATEKGLRGDDHLFFAGKMRELADIVDNMPVTCGTDGLSDEQTLVSLRYFGKNGAQWFIVEKDPGDPEMDGPTGPRQLQAYGLADLGMGFPEMGYINIEEITKNTIAELDYHFHPTNLLEVKKTYYPDLVRDEAEKHADEEYLRNSN